MSTSPGSASAPTARSGPLQLGRIAWVALAVAAAVSITYGVTILAAPIDDESIVESTAMATLNDSGEALRADIARIVEPAMQRTQKLALDESVIAALRTGDRKQLIDTCNRAVTSATEIDALALFDSQSRIVALNTVYASGDPVDPASLERVLRTDFSGRGIITNCMRDDADERVLEFQTQCDITPALFGSTGLSIAYSVPIRDPQTGAKMGVASARLRGERLLQLANGRTIGGEPHSIEFITDDGAYFSEDINSGRVAAPVPTAVLADLVGALVRRSLDYTFTRQDGSFLCFFRLKKLVTTEGGGVQVMLMAREPWLARETREARMVSSSGFLAFGVVLALLSLLVRGIRSLRHSERGTRLLMDTAFDAIVGIDRRGIITGWNPQAELTFGFTRAEAMGHELFALIEPQRSDPNGAVAFGDILAHKEDAMSGRRLEVSASRKDGARMTVELALTPTPSDSGAGYSVFLRDITEERQRELQVAQAQKLESIGQLAAGIAHEINTPTQYVGDNTRFLFESVTGIVELLRLYEQAMAACDIDALRETLAAIQSQRDALDLDFLQEEIPKAFEQSLDGIKRIAEIVLAMKEFSHPGSAERELADLNAAIESTATVARNRWKYVANLEMDLDPDLPKVPVLLGEFNQVMLNLIVNAADAISEAAGAGNEHKGTIKIRSRCDATHAIIEVSDDGPGIPDAVRDRIFDPFFTTKEVGKGTGQGLAICRTAIVKKHGGDLSVLSIPGKGATFTIRLPLEETQEVELRTAA